MKLRCIDNVGTGGDLIEGNIYFAASAVPTTSAGYVKVTDETGKLEEYFRRRFEIVEETPQADQWDASRGPKMADPKGKAIFKYQMPVLEQFEMKLPAGALIIRTEDQGGMFWLWAVVDTRAPDETRKFRAFKTGASIPDNFDGKYVGFCKIHVQQELGLYIFEDVAR